VSVPDVSGFHVGDDRAASEIAVKIKGFRSDFWI
jgi:hypothetical protein